MRKSPNKDRGSGIAQGRKEGQVGGKGKTVLNRETAKEKEVARPKLNVETEEPAIAKEPGDNKNEQALKPSAVKKGQSWVINKEDDKDKSAEGCAVEKGDMSTTGPVKEAAARLNTRVTNEQSQRCEVQVNGVRAVDNGKGEKTAGTCEVKKVEFCWNACRAGRVQVTGSFNDWKERIEMNEVDGVWKTVVGLEKGRYTYKFIVDGEWCYDIRKENVKDEAGNVNNVITV